MSRSLARVSTAVLSLSILSLFIPVTHALCEDPTGECAGIPCEAEDSCEADADCAPGADCVPWEPGQNCYASHCICDNGDWLCTDDCADRCEAVVPAVFERGLLILAILLVTSGSFVALWRRRVQQG